MKKKIKVMWCDVHDPLGNVKRLPVVSLIDALKDSYSIDRILTKAMLLGEENCPKYFLV